MSPPLWSSIDTGYANPYVCRTLFRIEKVLRTIAWQKPYWSSSGHLIVGNCEVCSIFPDWVHVGAANVQNRWFWTRKVLSL